jgi:hypothetical protein
VRVRSVWPTPTFAPGSSRPSWSRYGIGRPGGPSNLPGFAGSRPRDQVRSMIRQGRVMASNDSRNKGSRPHLSSKVSHPASPSATLEDGFMVTSVDFRKRACSIDRVGDRARRQCGEDAALFGRPCAKSGHLLCGRMAIGIASFSHSGARRWQEKKARKSPLAHRSIRQPAQFPVGKCWGLPAGAKCERPLERWARRGFPHLQNGRCAQGLASR